MYNGYRTKQLNLVVLSPFVQYGNGREKLRRKVYATYAY